MLSAILKNQSVRFFLFLAVIIVCLFLGKFVPFLQDDVRVFFSGLPLGLSGLVFVALYVLISFFIWIGPKDVFKIVGAVIYGPYVSSLFVYIAEMINAVALFSLSRWLGRGFVEGRLPGKMRQMDQAIADTSFLCIFFLRFFPVVPFRFLDIGFGLTRINLKKYFVISAIGSPLRIFFVQLFLSLGWETVGDPDRLAGYLIGHPYILGFSFIYTIGSLIVAVVLKFKMASKVRIPEMQHKRESNHG